MIPGSSPVTCHSRHDVFLSTYGLSILRSDSSETRRFRRTCLGKVSPEFRHVLDIKFP